MGSATSSCVPHKDLFPLWLLEAPSLSSSSWTSMNGWWGRFPEDVSKAQQGCKGLFLSSSSSSSPLSQKGQTEAQKQQVFQPRSPNHEGPRTWDSDILAHSL